MKASKIEVKGRSTKFSILKFLETAFRNFDNNSDNNNNCTEQHNMHEAFPLPLGPQGHSDALDDVLDAL